MRLDFIIAGGMKCGSTSLGNYLELHNEICIPNWETGFFNNDWKFQKGYDYYHELVGNCKNPNATIKGEKTPYSYNKNVTERIYQYNQNIKLIFIFRNPVDRAWSNYIHDLWHVEEKLSFENCIDQEKNRSIYSQYLSKGCYIDQVKDYLQYFKREQMYFLFFENLMKNREHELRNLFDFLEVNAQNFPYETEIHSKKSFSPKYHPAILYYSKKLIGTKNKLWNFLWKMNFQDQEKNHMNYSTRMKLEEFYEPYNQELFEFLQIDCDLWKPKPN